MRSIHLAACLLGSCLLAQSPPLAITATRLVDGRTGRIQGPVTILVQGERISAVGPSVKIPQNARVIDGSTFWVMPGIVETHTHISQRSGPRTLALGITAAHAMPNLPSPLLEMEAPSWKPGPEPRLFVTSPIFCTGWPKSHWPEAFEYATPRTPEEARTQVRALHAKGYRMIKIIQDDSALILGAAKKTEVFPPEILRALVQEAHARKMRVLVHVVDLPQARLAVDTGCDVLMHGVNCEQIDEALLRQMKSKGIFMVPTLAVVMNSYNPREYARRMVSDPRWENLLSRANFAIWQTAAREDKPDPLFAAQAGNFNEFWTASLANIRAAKAMGIPIALGNDVGLGIHTHLEMELLRDAGLSPAEILVAATWNAARMLGLEKDLGTVETGKLADLVILRNDPTQDIRNARDTEAVVKGGAYYTVKELRAPPPAIAVPAAKPSNQETEILATLDDHFAAVNARDPKKFLTFFVASEDLTVIEDKDLRLTRKTFEAFVAGFFKDISEIQTTWETRKVHPLAPGSAVVTGIFRIHAKDAKGAPMAFRNACTFVLVKREEHWLVKHVHESSLDL